MLKLLNTKLLIAILAVLATIASAVREKNTRSDIGAVFTAGRRKGEIRFGPSIMPASRRPSHLPVIPAAAKPVRDDGRSWIASLAEGA